MRPIPIDVIPSHVYLSANDQATLFGIGRPMTIFKEHSQPGQLVYDETVEVFGGLKRGLKLRLMGPNWQESQVYITPTEAVFLGLKLSDEARAGDLSNAAPCTLIGPKDKVILKKGVIIPQPHLLCSPKEAEELLVSNGQIISLETVAEKPGRVNNVVVRVHPTYRLRLEIHEDRARDLWITSSAHARLI